MTAVAESLPARVAFLAARQPLRIPDSIADIFLADFLEIVHMVEAHVFGVPDAVLILSVRGLEERLRS
jgi:hypothetical protein